MPHADIKQSSIEEKWKFLRYTGLFSTMVAVIACYPVAVEE